MESFTVHTGQVVCLPRDDIDTDQIVPARYCRRISRTGFADALFAEWRASPDFVLNDPRFADATILLGGKNFGTGSSREHAVWALRDYGFRAVISEKFGDIFQSNALKNGLLPIALPASSIADLVNRALKDAGLRVTVDLAAGSLDVDGAQWPFHIEPRARHMILNGLDEIDITFSREQDIFEHERNRPAWMPAVAPGETLRRCGQESDSRLTTRDA